MHPVTDQFDKLSNRLQAAFIRLAKDEHLWSGDLDVIIVRSTIGLAHSLGLQVAAEGGEDLATLERLRAFGCDEAQGYVLSKPMPAPVAFQTMLSPPPLGQLSTPSPLSGLE